MSAQKDRHEQITFVGQLMGIQKVIWMQSSRRDVFSRKDDFTNVGPMYYQNNALTPRLNQPIAHPNIKVLSVQ